MGTLFSTLDIARSGLQVAQVQLDTAGHNIANANTEGYSRQRVELAAKYPNTLSFGQLGRGVQVQNITRLRDQFLDNAFRLQNQALGQADVQAQYLSRLESLFQEPGSTASFSNKLNTFFGTLNNFANNVEESPVRQGVISDAQALSESFRQFAQQLYSMRTAANEEVKGIVPQINSLASTIAALNLQIRSAEAGGSIANDLRDSRDKSLDDLSKLVNITTREQSDGQVDVQIGSQVLVTRNIAETLVTIQNPALDSQRNDLVEVRLASSNELADIQGGQLYGVLSVRDGNLVTARDKMDELAAAIIYQVNRIQSQGKGLASISGTISSANPTTNATTALTASGAGLPFSVTPGTFDVVVYNSSGVPTTTTVTVTAATTLNSLAATLNAIPNFSASVTGGNTLNLGATGTSTFTFANDNSGVLAALNINGLFTGYDARTMGLNTDIVQNLNLLSSGYNTDLANTGDNTAALAMANIQNASVMDGNTATINQFYETTVTQSGVDSQSVKNALTAAQSFVTDIEGRRQSVSGVSLDEEATNLLQFQRAFEASSRVIVILDRMLDALLNIVQ